MSHFAKVGPTPAMVSIGGVVKQVGYLVDDVQAADAAYIAIKIDTSPGQWLQTSFNTRGGQHYNPTTGAQDTSAATPAIRGNYAGIGFIYDTANDVFYPPQPYPSWTISAPTWTWTPPTPMPTAALTYPQHYGWNESTKAWVVMND